VFARSSSNDEPEETMRRLIIAVTFAALTALPVSANAASSTERTVTGAAIGGTAGAVVAGPVGAVVGGTAGAVIGGPRVSHRHRHCWLDHSGHRHCRWR
jgi:hypothetical protein